MKQKLLLLGLLSLLAGPTPVFGAPAQNSQGLSPTYNSSNAREVDYTCDGVSTTFYVNKYWANLMWFKVVKTIQEMRRGCIFRQDPCCKRISSLLGGRP